MSAGRPLLVAFAGLPGSGKTTLARALAQARGAAWLRIDAIEQALRESGQLAGDDVGPAGYMAAYALAEGNLALGIEVVADSVNPLPVTRSAWREVAVRAGARLLEVEVRCSDPAEHRRRVESRIPDLPGLVPPDWQAVLDRDYAPWPPDAPPLVVETARRSIADCLAELQAALAAA
ncbi:AAA family ATPase [Marinibaculum pumilum]|uniref:AAA family ATPase n=1 Tax=Marinibaculum pumilum TaxID=1766165 RepID=A0ABV7L7K3_9PROT